MLPALRTLVAALLVGGHPAGAAGLGPDELAQALPGLPVTARVGPPGVVLVLSWVDRPDGVTPGGAHLVEHLSYAAADGHPPGGWDAALERLGGWSEGWTERDGVGGLVVLPPEAVGPGLALVADRLRPVPPARRGGALLTRQWAVVAAEARATADATAPVIAARLGPADPGDPRQPDGTGLPGLDAWWTPRQVLVVLPPALAATGADGAPVWPALPAPAAPPEAALPTGPPPASAPILAAPAGPGSLHLSWTPGPCPDPSDQRAREAALARWAAGLGGQAWSWWGDDNSVLAVMIEGALAEAPPWDGAAAQAALRAPAAVAPVTAARRLLARLRRPAPVAAAPCGPLDAAAARWVRVPPGAAP